ncbi:MAG TPA: aminoglycoside phosphotransferase family protein [Euzebyales bacterium]|nr:aminoglycoside phosphotransferase family protein [Euzebyales bacterium]
MGMHEHELRITVAMVRALVATQYPQWAALAIVPVASEGTVNAIFRIGEGLVARFPLQPRDVDETWRWLRSEAAAAKELRVHTRVPVPEPVAIGSPGCGYPLPWSVQTWLAGSTASERDPSASTGFARDLAGFIADVRSIDVGDRVFAGAGRGGDLRSHDEWMRECLRRSEHLLDVPPLRRMWTRLRELPRASPDAMTHGDLVPGNVLVSDGRLAGVLDVGGLGPADPALDLVGGWHLLDTGPRRLLRQILASDDLEWERGKAWAFEQAMGLVWYYAHSNPVMSQVGRRTLERLLADEASR